MKKKILKITLGLGSLFAFFVYTVLVKLDSLQTLDFNLMVKIQDKIPLPVNNMLRIFASVGRFEILLIALIIALVLNRKLIGGIIAFGAFGMGHVIEWFVKKQLHQPPPPFMFYRDVNTTTFDKDFANAGFSYPSGHSMRAIFLAIIFTYLVFKMKKLDKKIKLLLSAGFFCFAALIMIAKLSLGAHWPTDIVGGVLLGTGIAALSLLFL